MSKLQRNDDIAIIGMSGRFPGASSADEFWKNLCDGMESITFFSDADLLSAGVDPSLVSNPSYVKAAPILRDVEMFDASFFGYSPRDAALMDPQQRLFLEVCWEAFEDAGYDPSAFPGKVGVVSASGGIVSTYLLANLYNADLVGRTASITHINNDKDFLSTRVSFKLNLRGPSFTIQSACSSSLVAVHQACQTLRLNECDMMLVGGSAVRVPQVAGYLAEKRSLHSLDGHCRPFDALGQGTIFGSGVGAALLKPLAKAIADRDHIFAVIKGTAINNDGSSKRSFTAPSLSQQAQAITDALERAGVDSDSVGYLECHSTGTIVGDPLELEALTLAFRRGSERKQYCAVGSVKANIGHPEQAAGIAGLIKTALVLHHKRIPPSINFEVPNPAIDFASSPFYVNTKLSDFVSVGTPRRAGLNSLGIGGTNVFAVLEEAPPIEVAEDPAAGSLPGLVTLSAKSAEALIMRAKQLLNWLNENPDAGLGDVCYTTNVSRSQFSFRFAAPAGSAEELKGRLASWLQAAGDNSLRLETSERPRTAFMFSGQGSQYVGMAQQLYQTHPVFREAMDRCDALARPQLERSLLDIIFARDGDETLVNRTDYTQPAVFAVEYALTELLGSWGIAPDAVIGHSLGEIAAACAAKVLVLEDAMLLAIARGALMHKLPGGGAMVSIMASQNVIRPLIDEIAPEIAVAAMNGPLNTVVSGDRDALKLLTAALDRQGLTHRELHISNGFHSSRTDPILDEMEEVAGRIKYSAPEIPLISNLTGEAIVSAIDKTYWRRHIREAVRFGDGMLALDKLECQNFIEVGPHAVLLPMAQACLQSIGKSPTWIATLKRNTSDANSISEMLASLYLAGHTINWTAVHAGSKWRRIPLPTYPFQRKRHWIESNSLDRPRIQSVNQASHPLIGRRFDSGSDGLRFEARYGIRHIPYLSDHRVSGTVVLPTTVELEAATAAGRIYFGTSRISFDGAMHHQAISLADGEERLVRLSVDPLSNGKASLKIASASTQHADVWNIHMTGTIRKSELSPSSTFTMRDVRTRCRQTMPSAALYELLAKGGLEYGPCFRGVREVHLGQDEALTKVQLPDGLGSPEYINHPAFLDACLHAYPLVIPTNSEGAESEQSFYLPVALGGFRSFQDGIEQAWVHTRLRSVEKDGTQLIDIHAYDDSGRLVAELEGLAVRRLPLSKVRQPQASNDNLYYRVDWRQSDRAHAILEKRRTPASWLIFADTKGVATTLASRLEAEGHHCHLVYRGDAIAQQGPHTWTVSEREPRDFQLLLTQFSRLETLPCEGVIYMWGLDAPSIDGLTLERLKSGSEIMCRGALAALHSLVETRSASSGRRLWFVTANTQHFGHAGRDLDPVQAPLWGLGRTIAIEYPSVWGGLIDLQLDDAGPNFNGLKSELLHPDGENQIAISTRGERYIPRLVKQLLSDLPHKPLMVHGDAAYLVTGGLGMLGRNVTKWLVSKGARHIVLTGRNANPEEAHQILNPSELNGASIHIVPADVSREEDVERLIQWVRQKLPPLKGVVHSAGLLDDGILAQLNWDRFARLFEPRVYGGWLLHKYTQSSALDFFICKSSLLSLLGSAGQGNYTASSAFLDSLATYRRANDLPALAVNWCAWSGGGLATVSGARGEAMWAALGLEFVAPDFAMRAFDKLMQRDVNQIAVVPADWPTYARKVGYPPLLQELSSPAHISSASSKLDDTSITIPNSANVRSRQVLLSKLQQHIMEKLGITDVIDPNHRLNDLGVDSLMSVSLSNSFESEFGIPVPVADLISGPTINELVDSVFHELIQSSCSEQDDFVDTQTPILFQTEEAFQSWAKGKPVFAAARFAQPSSSRKLFQYSPIVSSLSGAATKSNGHGNLLHNHSELVETLQKCVGEELGFSEPIEPDQPLNEIGLDSLRSVSISNTLEKDFGIPVPVSHLIAGPTIKQLADYIRGALSIAEHTPAQANLNGHKALTAGATDARDFPVAFALGAMAGPRRSETRVAASIFEPQFREPTSEQKQHFLDGNGTNQEDVAALSRVNGTASHAFDARSEIGSPLKVPGKWLIAPRPNPNAKARLFCFPYAGGGVVSFRSWPQFFDQSLEVVAVEPPGRGTRISETAVEDLNTFVQGLLPELLPWLDRPSAFFGHCLGGLTMFATLSSLPESSMKFVKYAFPCGIRPPHLLKRRSTFEDELAYRMMLHPDFDITVPPHTLPDDLFCDVVRQFDTPAADRMLAIPKLRTLLLPAIRAEFGMAYKYKHQAAPPFHFPIASFVGASDPWVSAEDSACWGELTRGEFTNYVRVGSHFLMEEDRDFILEQITEDFLGTIR